MVVAVNITSNQGTWPGGTFTLSAGPISSSFLSLQTNAITFSTPSFISTTGPVGAFGVLIEPPSNNLIQLTLKGVTGDTGIPVSSNLPNLITFFNPAVANTVGLAAAAAISGVVTLTFF